MLKQTVQQYTDTLTYGIKYNLYGSRNVLYQWNMLFESEERKYINSADDHEAVEVSELMVLDFSQVMPK